jgi:hypothetical protein
MENPFRALCTGEGVSRPLKSIVEIFLEGLPTVKPLKCTKGLFERGVKQV